MPSWQIDEIQEILRMIESEHLDIRAVTLGVSLRDCASGTYDACIVSRSPVISGAKAALTARCTLGTPRKLVVSRTRRAPCALSCAQTRA